MAGEVEATPTTPPRYNVGHDGRAQAEEGTLRSEGGQRGDGNVGHQPNEATMRCLEWRVLVVCLWVGARCVRCVLSAAGGISLGGQGDPR